MTTRKVLRLFTVMACLSLLFTSCAGQGDVESPTPAGTAPATSAAGTPAPLAPTAGLVAVGTAPVPATLTATAVATAAATATDVPPTAAPTEAPTATATMTPTPAPPTATPTAVPQARDGNIFLGYYVPYDPSSWASLSANADNIDYVVSQCVSLDACGNIGTQDDLTLNAFARSKGIVVLPSVFTTSGSVNHSVLTDPAVSAKAIQQLVDYVIEEGYEGLDIDIEGVNPSDRPALTSFVASLSQELRGHGKMVAMALPAKTYDATTGWAGAYDYAALAPHVDLFTIMSYAYTTSSTAPGSTAPYSWVDKVAAFACSQIPPSKVLIGLAFYGYDWNVTMGGLARALRYPQAQAVAQAYGASINLDPTTKSATFSYQARAGDELVTVPNAPALNHEIKTRTRPPCGPPPPVVPTATPAPTPVPAPVQQHVVWLEDGAAVAAKLDIARRHGLRGVGSWRLGQEDPGVWPLLADYRLSAD